MQAVEDPVPLNEDFNPLVSSTPERHKKKEYIGRETLQKTAEREVWTEKAGLTSEETASRDEKTKG